MLALVLFPTLGKTCDDLAVCAHPTLIRSRTGQPCPSARYWEGYSGVESYKRRRFATSARSGKRVSRSIRLLMNMKIRTGCCFGRHQKSRRKTRTGEMSVHRMKFVLVNNLAPRSCPACAACSPPLEQGYLHDLATSRRYCGVKCYPQWTAAGGFAGSIGPAAAFELAVAWPQLTVDVASALFDCAWGNHRG